MTKDELIEKLQEMLVGTFATTDQILAATKRKQALAMEEQDLRMLMERHAEQQDMSQRLVKLDEHIRAFQDKIARIPKDRQTPIVVDVRTSIAREVQIEQEVQELSRLLRQTLDGGPERPLLSTELPRWIELRQGHAADKKIRNGPQPHP
jgi:hypothetical protein